MEEEQGTNGYNTNLYHKNYKSLSSLNLKTGQFFNSLLKRPSRKEMKWGKLGARSKAKKLEAKWQPLVGRMSVGNKLLTNLPIIIIIIIFK